MSTNQVTTNQEGLGQHDSTQLFLLRANSFYRRWHELEATFGKDGGLVLDWDYCPQEARIEKSAFNDRHEVLAELETLREELESVPENDLSNKTFFTHKLRGADAYVRALMGERIPFSDFIEATQGLPPVRASSDEIASLREKVGSGLARLGIPWDERYVQLYEELTRYPDMEKFGDRLREIASQWVKRVADRLGLDIEPLYEIETVTVDEFWYNFIDGKLGQSIRLRINTHPRCHYRKGDDHSKATHEIAGHALQVLSWNKQFGLARVESTAMNLTMHSCEMFQAEGVAQSIAVLIAEEGEIDDQAQIQDDLLHYHMAVTNNAQLDIEEGRSFDEVLKEVVAAAPFLPPASAAADLRDRTQNPMFRSYVHVYYPSAKMFLSAQELPKDDRLAFLRSMYERFWTPRQIEERLSKLKKPKN
jgi:hypothetical protein